MREQLEHLLLVLAVGAGVAIGAKRLFVPYNVALVIVGLLLVFTDVLPKAPMDPQVVLLAFLPVLVFEGALFADADGLLSARRPILALALPGVLISLMGTAAVATLVLALPFATALLLGALLSITDTVSVLLAFRSVRVPHRLAAIMEGESLFNDGTALVLVSLTTSVVMSGHFDVPHTLRELALEIVGGAVLGSACGALGSLVLRRTPDHLTAILASWILVFGTSLFAARMHASPVIAVVVAGLTVGRTARRTLAPSRVLALQGFWETAGFGLNVLLFLLVGMQIDANMLRDEAASIGLALIALHAGRAVAVYGCFGILRGVTGERVPRRWQDVMVFGNIKGALSMAAVLTLPEALPGRQRLVAIVFGVTFVTLVTQALPFRRLLVWLKVVETTPGDLATARATLIEARRGQTDLDDLLSSGLISRKDHAERRAGYQTLVITAEERLRAHIPDTATDARGTLDPVIETALLNGQKAALLDAARRGLVDVDVASDRMNAIDRQLIALANHHGAS